MADHPHIYDTPNQDTTTTKGPVDHAVSDEWLHDWHQFEFPLRNGTTRQQYKPKIEKYIKDWLDLITDIEANGKKYKLEDFDIVLDDTSGKFKATGKAVEDPPVPVVVVAGEPAGGGHILPTPPPPPPK